eukprot:SAG31_NODE_46_length_30980_cov_226.095107_15_plen_307_part_00
MSSKIQTLERQLRENTAKTTEKISAQSKYIEELEDGLHRLWERHQRVKQQLAAALTGKSADVVGRDPTSTAKAAVSKATLLWVRGKAQRGAANSVQGMQEPSVHSIHALPPPPPAPPLDSFSVPMPDDAPANEPNSAYANQQTVAESFQATAVSASAVDSPNDENLAVREHWRSHPTSIISNQDEAENDTHSDDEHEHASQRSRHGHRDSMGRHHRRHHHHHHNHHNHHSHHHRRHSNRHRRHHDAHSNHSGKPRQPPPPPPSSSSYLCRTGEDTKDCWRHSRSCRSTVTVRCREQVTSAAAKYFV